MTESSPATLTAHARRMQRLYRWQAGLFDLTRRPVLLGRQLLRQHLQRSGEHSGQSRRILEVGCGTGQNLAALAAAAGEQGSVLGVECAPAMARQARRRGLPGVKVLLGDYAADALATRRVDTVLFSYSLSMIPHYAAALAQARRDLRPGGVLLVLDFAGSRIAPLRAWMRAHGVDLGPERRSAIRSLFRVTHEEERRAWCGLWRYYLVVAERARDSTQSATT